MKLEDDTDFVLVLKTSGEGDPNPLLLTDVIESFADTEIWSFPSLPLLMVFSLLFCLKTFRKENLYPLLKTNVMTGVII